MVGTELARRSSDRHTKTEKGIFLISFDYFILFILNNLLNVTQRMYAEVVDGINLIWDNKFNEAEKIFSAKIQTHPRHALHHAEV